MRRQAAALCGRLLASAAPRTIAPLANPLFLAPQHLVFTPQHQSFAAAAWQAPAGGGHAATGVQPVEDCAAMRQAVPQRGMTAAAHNVAPQHGVFAVVEVSGTQHKVAPGDVVVVEKLEADVDDRLQLRRVLLLGSRAETVIGRPYVPQAVVTAAVEEQLLDGKVLVFHKRRRKNSRRLRGHRQPLTTLRILDIEGMQAEVSIDGRSAATQASTAG